MSRSRRATHFVLAAAALAAAGCAPHAPPASALLADTPTPRSERCTVAALPAELPPAAELVDAGFAPAAERLWVRAGRPAGHVLFAVRHAPDGTQVRRAVIESTVPPALADSLQALVFVHRQQTAPTAAEWGVRLRVDLGDPVALRVGRREECPPRPRERELRTAGDFDVRQADASSSAAQPPTDAGTVWVRVRLDENGNVTDASVERGISRGPWEQRLLNWIRTTSFYPALEDGYPVPSETVIAVRLSAVP